MSSYIERMSRLKATFFVVQWSDGRRSLVVDLGKTAMPRYQIIDTRSATATPAFGGIALSINTEIERYESSRVPLLKRIIGVIYWYFHGKVLDTATGNRLDDFARRRYMVSRLGTESDDEFRERLKAIRRGHGGYVP